MATVPVTIRVGSTLSESEPVANAELTIIPRIGETVAPKNHSLKVLDVIHHPIDGPQAHQVTIVATKGDAASDAKAIEQIRGY